MVHVDVANGGWERQRVGPDTLPRTRVAGGTRWRWTLTPI